MVYWALALLFMVISGFVATTKASITILQRTGSNVPTHATTTVQQQQRRRRFPYVSISSLYSLRTVAGIHTSAPITTSTTTNVSRVVSVSKGSSNTGTSTSIPLKKGPLQMFVQTILDSRRHLIAAAVARSTSIFIMYPADVIKTRLQMQQSNALRLTGLFNGVTGSLIGQVPYGVLTFGSYEMYKSYFLEHLPSTIPPIFKYAAGKNVT
jgi:hypothetical protein